MMSSLLEKAIVDATALKEAALKNAENSVIEKYADEIKEAVDTLLEQPEEDPFAELGDMEGTTDEASPEDAAFVDEVPSAATEGEDLCACPDEEEEITIDFDQLASEMEAEQSEMAPSDMTDRDQVAAELVQEVSNDELEQIVNILGELANHPAYDDSALPEEHPSKRVPLGKKFNAEPNKRGWGTTADPELQHELDIKIAAEKLAEEEKEELEEQLKRLQGQVSELQESKDKIRDVALQLKEKLEDVNLTNARLHYTNRVLNSTSLNERQKNKIVESISKAGSIEEAKVIYETLQSSVSADSSGRKPKSLSEAINRRSSSSLMVSRREPRNAQTDPALERMKLLAGIHNK
jgi:hypothetical protein